MPRLTLLAILLGSACATDDPERTEDVAGDEELSVRDEAMQDVDAQIEHELDVQDETLRKNNFPQLTETERCTYRAMRLGTDPYLCYKPPTALPPF